jgi:hypothetical protein
MFPKSRRIGLAYRFLCGASASVWGLKRCAAQADEDV